MELELQVSKLVAKRELHDKRHRYQEATSRGDRTVAASQRQGANRWI